MIRDLAACESPNDGHARSISAIKIPFSNSTLLDQQARVPEKRDAARRAPANACAVLESELESRDEPNEPKPRHDCHESTSMLPVMRERELELSSTNRQLGAHCGRRNIRKLGTTHR